ncbi:hypothetical protein Pmani_039864, partial [Petrolisthes manimaculis]
MLVFRISIYWHFIACNAMQTNGERDAKVLNHHSFWGDKIVTRRTEASAALFSQYNPEAEARKVASVGGEGGLTGHYTLTRLPGDSAQVWCWARNAVGIQMNPAASLSHPG